MCSTITIWYPFHPFHGRELIVERVSDKERGFVDCIDSEGRKLRVPLWMTMPDAAEHRVANSVAIEPGSLLKLVRLVRLSRKTR